MMTLPYFLSMKSTRKSHRHQICRYIGEKARKKKEAAPSYPEECLQFLANEAQHILEALLVRRVLLVFRVRVRVGVFRARVLDGLPIGLRLALLRLSLLGPLLLVVLLKNRSAFVLF